MGKDDNIAEYQEFLKRIEEENDCMKINNKERIIVTTLVVMLILTFLLVLLENYT